MKKKTKKKESPRTAVAAPKMLVKEFRRLCMEHDFNTAHEVRKMFKAWIIKHGGEL